MMVFKPLRSDFKKNNNKSYPRLEQSDFNGKSIGERGNPTRKTCIE